MSTRSLHGAHLPRLVILDRDGVINMDSDAYVKSIDEWHPIPGSLEAIARLNHAGILVAVASNQSGIARGLFDFEALNGIHAKFQMALARVGGHVDGIFFCPHGPEDGCECRKPQPGLLRSISLRFGFPLAGVPCIGDSPRDIQAALGARGVPLLVATGNGRVTRQDAEFADVPFFEDLSAAVDWILGGSERR